MLILREFDFMSNLPAYTSYLRVTYFLCSPVPVKLENSWVIYAPKPQT